MHQNNLKEYQHPHDFHVVNESHFRNVFIVIVITVLTMIAEIVFGYVYNSMALLSDGWHMATHASALCITFVSYLIAKRYRDNDSFTFGTWKIEILGAYTSALLLGIIGIYVVFSSVRRILYPLNIRYDQAILVTVSGLAVNIVCALVLNSGKHSRGRAHGHLEHEHDLSIKSAYLHVIADALTSVFAIIALIGAKLLRLSVLDPLMGILSSILILRWSFQLLRDTSTILMDKGKNSSIQKEISDIIESDGNTRISDLHLWKVGQNTYACIISLVAETPRALNEYKAALRDVHELAHVSIEIISSNE